ncbi:diguanylate cyclase domain-containing protein [Arthrobacter sp. AET 35A]|uniref:diguanylate cyclase domain-containing protein n=1 Tax=Arthrobacter sp. AET 35A TaxID=2292643 RepID=UPI00177F6552|nr:GGDEF domain-containing protein [Arthrobacter sp. AET 35A]MBE0010895.1 GGDEF domain-containing protein [Arthrobacter sp. AET 35A]
MVIDAGSVHDKHGSILVVLQWARSIFNAFPRGSRLPDPAWAFRHRLIILFAVVASAVITVVSLLLHTPLGLALAQGAIPALVALVAWKAPLGRRLSASLSSASLMLFASMAVQITGILEAHFLFFILVPVVALYEDWAPLATASFIVLGNYAVLGVSSPTRIYSHQSALEDPVKWSVIHSVLFLAMCATSIVHWRIHERACRDGTMLLDRLASQALHDPLTGLANRTLLTDRLSQALIMSQRTGIPVMVLAVDIDGFKPVNDSYGHAAGDALLIELGHRLESCIRAGDTAARHGGDEFTLLLPSTAPEEAPAMAERILAAVGSPVFLLGVELHLSVSIGIAVSSLGLSGELLLQEADQAMYAAKHNGRGGYMVFDKTLATGTLGTLAVHPDQAREWAAYTQDLRSEIAAAKELGRIPEQSRGPETVRRTLESIIAAIERLPEGQQSAGLALPERNALEEFVFHHDLVQHWADTLRLDSIIEAQRSPGADQFWRTLHQTALQDTNDLVDDGGDTVHADSSPS